MIYLRLIVPLDALRVGCAAGRELCAKVLFDEAGQDLIEYALVGALLAVAVAAAVTTLGHKIGNSFNAIGNNLTNAV